MRRNWRAPITPADLAPVREAKSDPIPSASLTGLRTQITRPPSNFYPLISAGEKIFEFLGPLAEVAYP